MRRLIFIFLCMFVAVSCEEIINEPNISNDTVVALAPINIPSLKEKEQINFNWQPVAGSNSYELQIATPNFSQAAQIQLDTLIENVSFSIDSLKLGNYEWRVRALNSAFETAYTTNGFTVKE